MPGHLCTSGCSHAHHPSFAIVIPTRDRPAALRRLLAVLCVQQKTTGVYPQVMVVDDGSCAGTAARNRTVCQHSGVAYLYHCESRGPAAARNHGVARTAGDWVVFLDDDVVPDEDWLSQCIRHIADATGDASIVGIEGYVAARGHGLWDREVCNTTGGAYLTCHMLYRRTVLHSIGGFDESFPHARGEDHECALRMLNRGRIVWAQRLRVVHLPARPSLHDILRRIWTAPRRVSDLLAAERRLYAVHPRTYIHVRHAPSFRATHRAIAFKNIYTQLHRRRMSQLVHHPLHTGMLVIAAAVEQVVAVVLLLRDGRSHHQIHGGHAGGHMARAHNECRDIQKITRYKKNGTPARVWMVASVPPHCQGGVHRVMRAHARALQAAGVRATLWYNECGMHDLVFTWYVLVKWVWALLRRRAPHVMVSRSTDGVWCALVSRIVPSPTTCVLYNHGWEEYAGEVYRDVQRHAGAWKSRLVRYVLLRLHLYTCRRCICGTVADMKWLRAHYPARAHVLRFVPNGVHVPRYGSDMPIRTQRRFRIRGTYRFLVVGQDTWRKHLDYAIALCHRLVTHFTIPVSLYCVGTGTQGARRIHTRWAGSPLAVHCSAGESMERMDRWYAHCPFVVSASRYEGGHSLALLEAMAHGCVVWAAPIPAHREFIRHGRNGFLLGADDIDRDATQVAAVLDDRRTLCSVSRYARRSAWRHRWQRQNTRFFRAIAVTP